MYASGVCSGKITPGGKKGRTKKAEGGGVDTGKEGEKKSKLLTMLSRYTAKTRGSKRTKKMGGGLMTRPMYKGGGLCTKGMGRAYGKNS
jgi:hypothetical protein